MTPSATATVTLTPLAPRGYFGDTSGSGSIRGIFSLIPIFTESTSSALEQFRQQWQQEVTARSQKDQERTRAKSDASSRQRPERPIHKPTIKHPLADIKDEDHVIPESSTSGALPERIKDLKLEHGETEPDVHGDADADEFTRSSRAEPETALEHYETAVEKEGQGQLGDSLSHYRKAFRLDGNVDKTYKEKHFAHKWKLASAKSQNPPVALPLATPQTQPEPASSEHPVEVTTAQLIASYAHSDIVNVPPMIEGDVPPPCPIKRLPSEVLLELFRHIAIKDVSIYARLASVCKKFAYYVYSENKIWKRIALGREFGLASQRYHFNTDVQGRPIIWQALEDNDDEDEKPMPQVTDDLFDKEQDWRDLFHSYPRIRFTGVYISTVNYTRMGGPSVSLATWSEQVHIVTYYRYLRFFRDGTVLSLLTTQEPIEVVHLLTKENVALVRAGGKGSMNALTFASPGHSLAQDRAHPNAPPPSAQNILKHALRGRWRLCHPSLESFEVGSNTATIGDIHIETEGGAGPRYTYTMHLSCTNGSTRSRPHATKNNKLVWKGFWSFNSMTGDWATFQLRHDKAFWFSRVKSYGMGY